MFKWNIGNLKWKIAVKDNENGSELSDYLILSYLTLSIPGLKCVQTV